MGVFLLWVVLVQAQDVVFTQHFSTLLYTNPAYSGALGSYRLGMAVRSQFTGLANPYNTVYADFDLSVSSLQGGFGIYVLNDRSDSWQVVSIGLSYSYAFNISENIIVRPALQAVYYRQKQNNRSYTFPDGIYGNGTSTPVSYPLSGEISQELDFASGVLISHPMWEVGFAVGHIGADRNDSRIAYADRSLKLLLHGRGAIPLSGKASLKDPDLSDWNVFENVKLIPHILICHQSKHPILSPVYNGKREPYTPI
jgi:type IX secretion system PorP/SprF family membrane protein